MLNDMRNRLKKNDNQKMKDFYSKTQENQRAGRKELKGNINKKPAQTEASPEWHYKVGAFVLTLIGVLGIIFILQYISSSFYNLSAEIRNGTEPAGTIFKVYWVTKHYWLLVVAFLPAWWYAKHRLRAIWRNNNAMFLADDIEGYENDSGLGFDGHVSAIVSHMMIDNKGINKIDLQL